MREILNFVQLFNSAAVRDRDLLYLPTIKIFTIQRDTINRLNRIMVVQSYSSVQQRTSSRSQQNMFHKKRTSNSNSDIKTIYSSEANPPSSSLSPSQPLQPPFRCSTTWFSSQNLVAPYFPSSLYRYEQTGIRVRNSR